jgi:hypothetical protein
VPSPVTATISPLSNKRFTKMCLSDGDDRAITYSDNIIAFSFVAILLFYFISFLAIETPQKFTFFSIF